MKNTTPVNVQSESIMSRHARSEPCLGEADDSAFHERADIRVTIALLVVSAVISLAVFYGIGRLLLALL